jgi:hypothetical protein
MARIPHFSRELSELECFVEISRQGLSHALKSVEHVDAFRRASVYLGKADPYDTPEKYERAKSYAKTLQEFAANQRQRSYPLLYYIASVRLWSILEATVDDMALERMEHPEKWQNKELVHGIKGPLLDFLHATENERLEFLLDELKLASKSSLRRGVGRFEALLQPLGLGGWVDDNVRRSLFELSQIRNAVVHKESIADKQFCNSCPWFNLKVGEPIPITHDHYEYFAAAVYWYLVELALRIERQFETRNEERIKEGQEIAESLAEDHEARRYTVWKNANPRIEQVS